MTGATNTDDGVSGLVPAPLAGDEAKFLRGDATWATVTGGGGSGTGISAVPQAYIAGFEVDYDGTNLTIQPGVARADGDDYTLIKTTAITINPAVTGVDGLDTGSLANSTWYYAWVIA